MVKLTVLYPRQEGGSFDMPYYLERHLPMTRRLLGDALKGLAVDEGVSDARLPAPYAVICELLFDSQEAMQSALDENVAALSGDIANYTNVQPVFQFSRVVSV